MNHEELLQNILSEVQSIKKDVSS